MLQLVVLLKTLVELAAFFHVGQGLLFLFAGKTRDRNPIYKLFVLVNRPVWKATRFITPRFIIDAHVGFVSFFLLAVLWVALVVAKIHFYLVATPAPA